MTGEKMHKSMRQRILSWLFLPLDEMSAEITQLKRENANLRAILIMKQDTITMLEHAVDIWRPAGVKQPLPFAKACRRCHDLVTDEKQWNEEKGGCAGCFFPLDRPVKMTR